MEVKKEPEAEIQAKRENKGKLENKKKGTTDWGYFNPWLETRIEIFGRDLLNKDLILYSFNKETTRGKMARYSIYKILVEAKNKKFIAMKPAIKKITGLDKEDIEPVKKFPISQAKAKQPPENASCPLYEKGCNNMLCPMLSEPGIWYSEEDLCLNREYRNDPVVINQKKLKKKHPEGYFTSEMLSRRLVIRSGISGIDPDVPSSIDMKGQSAVDNLYLDREKQWTESHKEIPQATRENRKAYPQKMADNMRKIRIVIEIIRVKK